MSASRSECTDSKKRACIGQCKLLSRSASGKWGTFQRFDSGSSEYSYYKNSLTPLLRPYCLLIEYKRSTKVHDSGSILIYCRKTIYLGYIRVKNQEMGTEVRSKVQDSEFLELIR